MRFWNDRTYPGGSGITSDHQDGADGAVLGQETGSLAAGGQDDNGTGVQLQTGADGSHGDGLGSLGGARSQVAELIEDLEVRNGDLGQETGLVHHLDSLARVVTLGGLARQHDTVSTVQDGVGNVGNLSTGGARVVCHGLEHLSGANNGLALDVALGNHHLLGDEHLGGGDLDTQVTTGDHDTVSGLQDLVKVVNTLLVLDLGNDLNLLALLAENLTDLVDVATTADERGENHIDLVLHTELQIGNVLLRQSGEVYVGTGEVDTLARRDVAVVQALDAQGLLINNLEDLEGQDAVVDINELARRDHLGDVLVVKVPTIPTVSLCSTNLLPQSGDQKPCWQVAGNAYIFLSSLAVA